MAQPPPRCARCGSPLHLVPTGRAYRRQSSLDWLLPAIDRGREGILAQAEPACMNGHTPSSVQRRVGRRGRAAAPGSRK